MINRPLTLWQLEDVDYQLLSAQYNTTDIGILDRIAQTGDKVTTHYTHIKPDAAKAAVKV